MKGTENVDFFTFSDYGEALRNFQEHYDLYHLVVTPDAPQPKG